MARRGPRQVLQLDDVSSSHSPRPQGFAPVRSEEATRKATNSLLSLVSYASDASSDEDSDNDSKADEQHTPPSSSTKEDNNPGNIEGELVLEIPLPAEAEPLRVPEPQEVAEPPKPAEPVKESEPPPMVESMLDIPLPESSCPPPKQRSQPKNVGIESELANFFAEIESISTENVPPDTEEIPLPATSSSSLATTPEPPTTVDSSQPVEVDHGFIPRPDASVSKATEEDRPVSPVQEKVKATSSKSAYQSMFVKGASEFVKVDKEEKKENGVEEEELPEEPVSEWQMVQDDSTGYYYYWNMGTNEVTWEIPPGYTQFLLLYKEYEERIAAIPKDKLLRLKEKKKQSDTSGRESSPAPSSSKSKKEKKHKRDKHRKEKPESTSSVQIGPQLPPMPAEDNGTDGKVMADQSDAKTADDVRTAASPQPSSEEKKIVKTGEILDSAVDSTSVSVPQDVEAIFDEALSAVMESHVDSSRTDAPLDMFRDDEPSKEKSVVPAVTSSSVTGTSSAPPSLDAASVDSSKSASAESSKTGSPAPADSDSTAVLATVSVSTSVVSSSSVVSSVSLSLRDSRVDNGGEGLVTNSGMNESVATGEEEDDLDMDFDDIDDVDRALEKALEKKKAELEKLESRGEEDMVTSDSQPQSSSLPTNSSQSDAPEQNALPAEAESAVSSSVKSTAASSPVAGPSSKSSSSAAAEDRDAAADSSEARSESSKRKRSAAESSTKDESSKRREPVPKKTRLVVYDAAETDEESMDASEEVSTSPAPSGKTSGDVNSVAEVVPTPPSESADISKEMADMANTACAKLAFLDVTVEGLSRLQTSLIALQTRMTDWQNGGLSNDYFYQRLKEVNDLLTQYESSAVPRGWTCQWDSDFRRYFYIHETTKRTQWEYPEPSPDEAPKAEERKPKKSKSSKKKRSKVIGPEPLPLQQNNKTAGTEDNEAAVSYPDGTVVACPDGTTALQDGTTANQDGTAADQDGMDEDLDGVAMNREEADNQESLAANGERDKQASTSTSTSSDGLPHSEGMATALQALFPGEPLPPGTELLLGLPPPPPPPLPAADDNAATASTTSTTTTTTSNTNVEDAYVCADDSSDESSEKSGGRERSSEEVLPNLDPDIDGEEMVEEEEEEGEGGGVVVVERGGREEESVPAMVVEDPAVISRPPQLCFPPAASATSSAVAYVSSSSVLTGMDSATLSSQPVLSAAPVLKTTSSLPLPDSASSGLTASPQREDGHRRSPAPSQERSSSSGDRHKSDKPEKHKKKKKGKLGSHTMSLKKKGLSNMVQNWEKVQKEAEKEERASQQRQAAIRQQLDEWKKGSS